MSNISNGFKNPWDHHAIVVRLKTASLVGCKEDDKKMVLIIDEDDKNFIDNYLNNFGIRKKDIIIGFQVGAAKKYKVWPEKNFIELGRKLLLYKSDICIILIGSEKEQYLCNFVAKEIGGSTISVSSW